MLNQFAICGVLEKNPEHTRDGKYLALRIRADDGNGRSTLVEAICKEGDWYDNAVEGSTVIASGKLTGRVNDKGYLNMGLWAFDVHVLSVPETRPKKEEEAPFPTDDDDIVF